MPTIHGIITSSEPAPSWLGPDRASVVVEWSDAPDGTARFWYAIPSEFAGRFGPCDLEGRRVTADTDGQYVSPEPIDLDMVARDALDAAIRHVQYALGVTDGGLASHWWDDVDGGDGATALRALRRYTEAEAQADDGGFSPGDPPRNDVCPQCGSVLVASDSVTQSRPGSTVTIGCWCGQCGHVWRETYTRTA